MKLVFESCSPRRMLFRRLHNQPVVSKQLAGVPNSSTGPSLPPQQSFCSSVNSPLKELEDFLDMGIYWLLLLLRQIVTSDFPFSSLNTVDVNSNEWLKYAMCEFSSSFFFKFLRQTQSQIEWYCSNLMRGRLILCRIRQCCTTTLPSPNTSDASPGILTQMCTSASSPFTQHSTINSEQLRLGDLCMLRVFCAGILALERVPPFLYLWVNYALLCSVLSSSIAEQPIFYGAPTYVAHTRHTSRELFVIEKTLTRFIESSPSSPSRKKFRLPA